MSHTYYIEFDGQVAQFTDEYLVLEFMRTHPNAVLLKNGNVMLEWTPDPGGKYLYAPFDNCSYTVALMPFKEPEWRAYCNGERIFERDRFEDADRARYACRIHAEMSMAREPKEKRPVLDNPNTSSPIKTVTWRHARGRSNAYYAVFDHGRYTVELHDNGKHIPPSWHAFFNGMRLTVTCYTVDDAKDACMRHVREFNERAELEKTVDFLRSSLDQARDACDTQPKWVDVAAQAEISKGAGGFADKPSDDKSLSLKYGYAVFHQDDKNNNTIIAWFADQYALYCWLDMLPKSYVMHLIVKNLSTGNVCEASMAAWLK